MPCKCLLEERRVKRWRDAGIPLRHDGASWRTLLDAWRVKGAKTLLGVARALKRSERGQPWLVLYGHPTRARTLASTLLLRSACDGGFETRQADLRVLVDLLFGGKDRDDSLYEVPVLAIQVGGEPSINKWTKHVIERVLTERWNANLFTVLISSVDPSTLGGRYQSAVVGDALRDKFKRVTISGAK